MFCGISMLTLLTRRIQSWFSWTRPRKAVPVTQLAPESILSDSNTAPEALTSVKRSAKLKTKRSPSLQLTLGKANSNRSPPADATTTRVNAVSRGSVSAASKLRHKPVAEEQAKGDVTQYRQIKRSSDGDIKDNNLDSLSSPRADGSTGQEPSEIKEPSATAIANGGHGWLGWFSRPTLEPKKASGSAPPSLRSPDPPLPPDDASSRPPNLETDTMVLPPVPGDSRPIPSKPSWLQMWSGGSAKVEHNTAEDTQVAPSDQASGKPLAAAASGTSISSASNSQVLPAEPSAPPTLRGSDSKSSGWVFWSRDHKADGPAGMSDEAHVGEIAVSDTPSQKRPRKTSITLDSTKPVSSSKDTRMPITKGQGTAKAKDVSSLQLKDSGPSTPTQKTTEAQKEGTATSMSAKLPAQDAEASKQLQASVPNLLLPSFSETFTLQETPNLLQLLGRLLNYSRYQEEKHLHRIKDVPKLKSALAIGVHGYFPAPLIRTVLGQPTGTSIKFADMAAKAIRKWTESHGYSCEVKTAALEGEGRIAERIDLLWKLLLNWIDEIRKADFVMIACHSQGVPVAMMLVAKLVDFGCVNSAKIGICAMAGVSLGPFSDYRSRWISGSAGELFDFSNSSSIVSKDYLTAAETVVKFGVHVVYVGSIDDQLVSLESSTFSPISHPHICRAVFVDGRIHAPNFLVHLVGFALKLRNLGVQDHGLIRELSGPLAGSLYTGEGHSRIYEENAVYDLAVEFALETNAIKNAPLSQKLNTTPSANPYILPWAVRGILEEDFVKSDLRDEANELLKQFDDWKPATKVLKDVKFRLEGIRSKL